MKYVRKLVDNYCVMDLETAGLSPYKNDIIEICILKVRNNQIVDQYVQLVNPGYKVNRYITHLTGITNTMLKNQPTLNTLRNEVVTFIGHDIIVGHNTNFDVRFLQVGLNETFDNEYVDTLQYSRKLYPQLSHHSLSDMSEYLNLSKNTHRALDDCICTKELYDCIKDKML
ncbi:MAG: 3'-5' exonuclease [Erysipelotrichaceae bacterium]|nr:3'-5' exonuclease [Erysipelotrichaceae bacterium]